MRVKGESLQDRANRYIEENPPPVGPSPRYYAAASHALGVTVNHARKLIARSRDNRKVTDPAADEAARKVAYHLAQKRHILDLEDEVKRLNRENEALMRGANAQDRIVAIAAESLKTLPAVDPPAPVIASKGTIVESAVALWSDWHLGETVNAEEMAGINAYDFNVAVRRIQYLVDTHIAFTTKNMKAHRFDELHLFCLGDMVSGIIHDLEETNSVNIVEQVTLGALVFASAVRDLARAFPTVTLTCIVGNHGRMKPKPYFKRHQQINWDYLFYNYAALMLKDQRNVRFNIPLAPFAAVEVKGKQFFLMHGDGIRSWGSIPYYGIDRAVARWTEVHALQDIIVDYVVMGHFHEESMRERPRGRVIVNGTLMGGTELGMKGGRYSSPRQLIFGVHGKRGMTWELSLSPTKEDEDGIAPRYAYDRSRSLAGQVV